MMNPLEVRSQLVDVAISYVGKINYKSCEGGPREQDPSRGLSCYNFVRFVVNRVGILVPEGMGCWEMYESLPVVQAPLPGDLVFRNGRRDGKPGHVGIYAGNGVVHLPKSAGTVVESGLDELKPILGFRSIGPYIEARQ